jgi:hypothetical protein
MIKKTKYNIDENTQPRDNPNGVGLLLGRVTVRARLARRVRVRLNLGRRVQGRGEEPG